MEQTRVIMLMMAFVMAVLSFAATSKSAAAKSRTGCRTDLDNLGI